MAITLVTSGTGANSAANGADFSLTLPTMLQDDAVYVTVFGYERTGNPSVSTAGYTLITSVTDSLGRALKVYRKLQGATPDTTVAITGTADASDGAAATFTCLRGVYLGLPEDGVYPVTVAGISNSIDASAITTITPGAWVYVSGGGDHDTAVTTPTSYTNAAGSTISDTNSARAVSATREIAAPSTENPGAWTAWTTSAGVAATIVVRAAPSDSTARYWVGGTGNWSDTARWSTSSGGAGGASVPTWANAVYFDGSSGTGTATINATAYCDDLICTGYTGTLASTYSLSVFGNLVWASGMTLSGSGGFVLSPSGETNKTITSNTKTFMGPLTLNGYADEWTLADSANFNAGWTVTAGTFRTGNYAITSVNLGSTGSLPRAVYFGSSAILFSGSGATLTVSGTGLTFDAGTSTVTAGSTSGPIFVLGGVTLNNLTTTANSALTLGNGTIGGTLTVPVHSSGGYTTVSLSSALTVNNFTVTGVAANRRVLVQSANTPLVYNLTVTGTMNLTDVDFRDIRAIGASAPITGTRLGNRGGNSGITTSTPKTVYWKSDVTSSNRSFYGPYWATSSGGATSQDNMPLAQDTAIFDENSVVPSGSGLVTISYGIGVGTVDFSARSTAVRFDIGAAVPICGNLILSSAVTYSGSGTLTFSGRNTQTITSAGKTITHAITIDSPGGTVQLGDAFTSTGSVTVTNGTFDTAGYTVTAGTLTSSTTGVRTINLGASTLTLSDTYAIDFTVPTNLTFNCGTSSLILSQAGNAAIYGGGQTFYDAAFTGGSTGVKTISGVNSFRNLQVTVPGTLSLAADQTVTGTLTLTGTSATSRLSAKTDLPGTLRTITAAAVSLTDVDFQDVTGVGAAAPFTGTRLGDLGNNSGITCSTPKTVYWNLAGTQNWNATAWATTSGGAPAVNNFPLVQDTAVFDDTGSVGIVTLNVSTGTINTSARTAAMTLTCNSVSVYGDLTLGSGVTSTSNSNTVTFAKRGTQTLTCNGVTFGSNITANPGVNVGKLQLGDALLMDSARTLTLTYGEFDAVTYNVTVGLFSSSTNGKTLRMGSGLWTLTGTGTVWTLNATGSVFYKGTANITLSDTSTAARTFSGGGMSYNTLTVGGTTGISTLTVSGSNQFKELASTKTVAHTLTLAATQTVGKWSITGTAGNVVTITTGFTISIVGACTSGIDYLSITGMTVSSTSPGEFYAGVNSTNVSGNTGVVFTATPASRTLYWVGGTGNWSSTTKWALTSGGASGEAVPTSVDSVTFDTASNATAYTATVDAVARCAALTLAGPASGNVTWAGSALAYIHGNVSIAATGVTRTYTGGITLSGSATGKTFSCGLSLASTIIVDGVSCGWSLTAAFTTSSSFTVTNGVFDTAGYAFSINSLLSTNSNTRAISLGASSIIPGTSGTAIDFTTSINLTLDAGTSTFTNAGNGTLMALGNTTLYNLTFTSVSSGTRNITGTPTINNLTVAGSTAGISNVTFAGNATLNSLVTTNSSAINRVLFSSSVIGTTRTLTVASAGTVVDADFRDITVTGAAAPISGTRLGDCKGNSGITFPAAKTVYWNLSGAQNLTATGWATSSGGAPAANNFPLPQDTAVFDNTGSITGTLTFDSGFIFGTIDASARTNAATFSFSNAFTLVGNLILGSGINPVNISSITFSGRNTQTITSAGKSWPTRFIINSPGGTVRFTDTFTSAVSNTPELLLTAGTLDGNGQAINVPHFSASGSTTRTLLLGNGTWTISSTGTPWDIGTSTNLTLTKGTSDIVLSDTSTTARTFAGGGQSYNKLTIGGTTGISTTTITGNNTFTELASTKTVAHTIALAATTQTVGVWSITGTVGNVVTVTGTSGAAPATLIGTGATPDADVDYLSLFGVKAYPPVTSWYAGANSVNLGEFGWYFTSASGVTYRVLVSDSGVIKQYVSSGARLRLDAGVLKTTAGGRALVWDSATNVIREAADGETLIQP